MVREVGHRASGERGRASSAIWLVGVGVGLLAAGTGAYLLVRRRLEVEAEQPVIAILETPPSGNGHTARARDERSATSGATKAAETPPEANRPDETWGRMASETSLSEAAEAQNAGAEDTSAVDALEQATDEADAGVETIRQAPFIGNIRTMVYHEADAEGLPAEENRIYFTSEQDAREAGFRRDRDEVSPAAESGSPTPNAGQAGS